MSSKQGFSEELPVESTDHVGVSSMLSSSNSNNSGEPPSYEEVGRTETVQDEDEDQDQELHYQPSVELPPTYLPNLNTLDGGDDYGTGLFACHQSLPICLAATCLPCWSWGTINVALTSGSIEVGEHDEGHEAEWKETMKGSLPYLGLFAVQLMISPLAYLPLTNFGQFWLRTRLRKKYGMEAHNARDLCSHIVCSTCALAQDHREMVRRERSLRQGYSLSQAEETEDLVV